MGIVHIFVLLFAVLLATSDAECPNGFVHHGKTCYHFSHDQEYWNGAREMCKFLNSQLLEINDVTEGNYITAQVSLTGRHYFMGGNDVAVEGDWVWSSDSRKISDQSYINWPPGQPDNAGDNENCLMVWDGGIWNDVPCGSLLGYYICERPFSEEVFVG